MNRIDEALNQMVDQIAAIVKKHEDLLEEDHPYDDEAARRAAEYREAMEEAAANEVADEHPITN